MNSSNSKLIDVMKKRISVKNRNNRLLNQKEFFPTTIFKLRGSKDFLDSKIDISKKNDRNHFLFEDQINLRIVPLIKKKKCVFKYETLIEMKKNDIKRSNGISTSFVKPSKTYVKKYLFKSPFQERKKSKYKLKNMINLSKRIHSPKFKENKVNNVIFKTVSRNDKNNFKNDSNMKLYLKTCGNIKNIFNDIKLDRIDKRIDKLDKTNENVKQNKYLEQKNENTFLMNIIKIKERNRRARNYYNKIHVNKVNKIIEKFSFNNYD